MSETLSATPEDEIERICASPAFQRSATQTKLLRYLAREVLAGRGRQLNQYLIATDGMGLSTNFDPAENSSVRVWGVRLRRMLEEFYADPANAGLLRVRLPERTFCPVFEKRGSAVAEPRPEEFFPKLAVVEFRGVGLRGSWRVFPSLLAGKVVACVSAMNGISALGPFERNAGAAEIGRGQGADFVLDGALFAGGDSCLAQARLLRADTGVVCGAKDVRIKIRKGGLPGADSPMARRLTRFVEEGFGTLWREVERVSHSRPPGQLSTNEAMMHVWHAYSTMSPSDISAAQQAIRSAGKSA